MLEGLTQTQQWGIAYLVQLYNAESERYNATVGDRNRFLPRDQPLLEERPLLDEDAYVVKRITEIADQGYQQLIAFKEQEALRIFRGKSLAEQEALLVQLQVPDVLKEKQ
jgi:hypothetical protein